MDPGFNLETLQTVLVGISALAAGAYTFGRETVGKTAENAAKRAKTLGVAALTAAAALFIEVADKL